MNKLAPDVCFICGKKIFIDDSRGLYRCGTCGFEFVKEEENDIHELAQYHVRRLLETIKKQEEENNRLKKLNSKKDCEINILKELIGKTCKYSNECIHYKRG